MKRHFVEFPERIALHRELKALADDKPEVARSVLVYGPRGSGQSTLASFVAGYERSVKLDNITSSGTLFVSGLVVGGAMGILDSLYMRAGGYGDLMTVTEPIEYLTVADLMLELPALLTRLGVRMIVMDETSQPVVEHETSPLAVRGYEQGLLFLTRLPGISLVVFGTSRYASFIQSRPRLASTFEVMEMRPVGDSKPLREWVDSIETELLPTRPLRLARHELVSELISDTSGLVAEISARVRMACADLMRDGTSDTDSRADSRGAPRGDLSGDDHAHE